MDNMYSLSACCNNSIVGALLVYIMYLIASIDGVTSSSATCAWFRKQVNGTDVDCRAKNH